MNALQNIKIEQIETKFINVYLINFFNSLYDRPHLKLSFVQKAIIKALVEMMGSYDSLFMSYQMIADKAGCNRRTVIRHKSTIEMFFKVTETQNKFSRDSVNSFQLTEVINKQFNRYLENQKKPKIRGLEPEPPETPLNNGGDSVSLGGDSVSPKVNISNKLTDNAPRFSFNDVKLFGIFCSLTHKIPEDQKFHEFDRWKDINFEKHGNDAQFTEAKIKQFMRYYNVNYDETKSLKPRKQPTPTEVQTKVDTKVLLKTAFLQLDSFRDKRSMPEWMVCLLSTSLNNGIISKPENVRKLEGLGF